MEINDLDKNAEYLKDDRFMRYFNEDLNNARFNRLKETKQIQVELGYLKDIQRYLTALKSGKNVVFLSPTGTGKTLCALEIAYRLKLETYLKERGSSKEEFKVYYSRYNLMQSEFKGNFSNYKSILDSIFEKESIFYVAPHQKTRLIIIDEIHNDTNFTLLNEVIMMAYDNLVPILLLGNCNRKEIADNLSAMALSRLLEQCELVDGVGDDLRARR